MIYNLPHDLTPANAPDSDPVIIRWYRSKHNTVKTKIILHKNMINLLVSGEKTLLHAEGATTIREGEFLILSCGNCLTTEVLPLNDIFSSIIIYFDNEWLTDFLNRYEHLTKDASHKKDVPHKKETPYQKSPFLTFRQDPFIVNYIHSLRLLLQFHAPLSLGLKKLKLEELLLYLVEKERSKLYSLLILAQDDPDLQVKKAVESNIGNPVTVEELAFLCNCSPSTFKRRFKRIYGIPPQKWLLEQKMRLAANLLRQSHERPGLVYQRLGYENHSSFTQSFKRQYGMTPKEYQEQNGAG